MLTWERTTYTTMGGSCRFRSWSGLLFLSFVGLPSGPNIDLAQPCVKPPDASTTPYDLCAKVSPTGCPVLFFC